MLNCPKCHAAIPQEKMNIQTDIAQCISCRYLFKISSEIKTTTSTKMVDLSQPPSGAWYANDHQTIHIGATTRSYVALFLIPFLSFWSYGILNGANFINFLEFDFFLLPFLLIGGLFWWIALMSVIGKVEIKVTREGGTIFVGIWKIGINKYFLWEDIDFIQEESVMFIQYPGNRGVHINMEGRKRYTFGSGLSQERRYYLIQALKSLHQKYSI